VGDLGGNIGGEALGSCEVGEYLGVGGVWEGEVGEKPGEVGE